MLYDFLCNISLIIQIPMNTLFEIFIFAKTNRFKLQVGRDRRPYVRGTTEILDFKPRRPHRGPHLKFLWPSSGAKWPT